MTTTQSQSTVSLWLVVGIAAWYAVSTLSSILLNSALHLRHPATTAAIPVASSSGWPWLLPLADSLLFTCLSSLTSILLSYTIQCASRLRAAASHEPVLPISTGSSPCSEYRAYRNGADSPSNSSDIEESHSARPLKVQVMSKRSDNVIQPGSVALLSTSHVVSSCCTAYALTLSSIICVHTWRALEPAVAGLFTYCAFVAQQKQLVGSQQGISRSLGLLFVVAGVWLATSSEASCTAWQSIVVAGVINVAMIVRNSTIKSHSADQLDQAYTQMYVGSTVMSALGLLAVLYAHPTVLLSLLQQREVLVLMLAAAVTQSIYTQLSLTVCTRVALTTHSLLTLVKRPLLLIAASVYYATTPSTVTIFGNAVSLFGLAMYVTSSLHVGVTAEPVQNTNSNAPQLTCHQSRASWVWGGAATAMLLLTVQQRQLQRHALVDHSVLQPDALSAHQLLARLWHSDAVAKQRKDMQMLPLYTGGGCDYSLVQNAPLYYWRRPWLGHNFGDRLSWILLQEVLATYDDVTSLNTAGVSAIRLPNAAARASLYRREDEPTDLPLNTTGDVDLPPPRLLAIGSIMQFTLPCDVVWGSGARSLVMEGRRTTNIDIRAVRGPLTRQYLLAQAPELHVPEVYGDPALLTPLFFPEFITAPEQRSGVLVIAHFADIELVSNQTICTTDDVATLDTTRGLSGLPDCYITSSYAGREIRFMNALDAWDEVIGNITASELVISTSLHGIILADAYGIPARVLRLSELSEPLFKYADYYAGTERAFQPVGSIQEALWMGGEQLANYDPMPLLQAFPIDLYTS